VPHVINFDAKLLFINPVDDPIAPHAVGTVAVEFAG
jgi:hypothetical protein